MTQCLAGFRKAFCLVTVTCLLSSLVPPSATAGQTSRVERVLPGFGPGVKTVSIETGGLRADGVLAGWLQAAGTRSPWVKNAAPQPDSLRISKDDQHGSGSSKILGTSLFISGVFLCSWGIASWQVEEYQCCPPRNTENVIKIVVGVVLVNAGLLYLLGGAERAE